MTTVIKKTLTKPLRAEIARDMVIAASQKTGDMLGKELAVIQDCIKGCLLAYFYGKVPEVHPDRVLELLQQRVLSNTDLGHCYVYPTEDSEKFGELEWLLSDRTEANLKANAFLWEPMVRGWTGHKTSFDSSCLSYTRPELSIVSNYADIPYIIRPSMKPGEAKGTLEATLVNQLNSMHGRAMVVLSAMRDLLEEAREMYDNLLLAMQQFKNTEQLVEGIPESVNYFPDALFEPAPTKQVADPKFLNDIRAKLAKGLPV